MLRGTRAAGLIQYLYGPGRHEEHTDPHLVAGWRDRTGLARSGDDEAVRWIAVRHAPGHIHIVATLARQDGTKPRIWNDFYRVREACQAVERRYGLRVTAPGDRPAGRRPTQAEQEHARRRGWEEPARTMLRRAVHTAAAGASSEHEFFARLEAAGLGVRKRFSQRDPGQVSASTQRRA